MEIHLFSIHLASVNLPSTIHPRICLSIHSLAVTHPSIDFLSSVHSYTHTSPSICTCTYPSVFQPCSIHPVILRLLPISRPSVTCLPSSTHPPAVHEYTHPLYPVCPSALHPYLSIHPRVLYRPTYPSPMLASSFSSTTLDSFIHLPSLPVYQPISFPLSLPSFIPLLSLPLSSSGSSSLAAACWLLRGNNRELNQLLPGSELRF